MGRRQRDYDRMMATLQSWINRSTQESPYESELREERGRLKGFIDSKDYRNLPTGVNIDMLPLADYKRQRSYLGSGDNVAKGAMNADAIRNQRELDDNQLTRDWGQAYEQKVGGLMDRYYGMTDQLQGLHSNRMNAGIQGSQSMLQGILNRPKGTNWLGGLLNLGAQALPSILAAI